MAADIGLWQMMQEPKTSRTTSRKDYISALWSEYKREQSDRVLGHMVGDMAEQSPAEQQRPRRPSLTRMPAMSRSNSIDSSVTNGATTEAHIMASPSPPAGAEQPRRESWWRRPSSSPKDMESFIHMAFAVS